MMTGITQERLRALLAALPAHEPVGVRLLREMGRPQPGQLFPAENVDRATFVEATQQAMTEHRQIDDIVRALRDLTPVVTATSLGDYS
jgi:hypothetical protein